jgi:hypothetical protein
MLPEPAPWARDLQAALVKPAPIGQEVAEVVRVVLVTSPM